MDWIGLYLDIHMAVFVFCFFGFEYKHVYSDWKLHCGVKSYAWGV